MRPVLEEQISAFLGNHPGVVADLCEALNERNINIRALTVLETCDIGTLRMIVDNVELTKEVLRTWGAAYIVSPVIAITIPDRPGAFGQIARRLANEGINIEYVYASALPGSHSTLGVFRVSDTERALEMDFSDVVEGSEFAAAR